MVYRSMLKLTTQQPSWKLALVATDHHLRCRRHHLAPTSCTSRQASIYNREFNISSPWFWILDFCQKTLIQQYKSIHVGYSRTWTYKPWIGNSPISLKTITNNSLPSILSAHPVSIWRFHSVSIWGFRQYSDRLESVISVNFRIWSQYVG